MATQVWAHRGASAYAPENTLTAFKEAVDLGADGIELDVHLTDDGEIVVAHDDTIDRCSDGTGLIAQKTLAELSLLNFATQWPGHAPERIPTLSQVLELMKPTGLEVNIELKSATVIYPDIEARAVALVKSLGMENRVIYSSFNHYSLMLVRKADPDARIGLLYQCAMVDPWVYALHLRAQAIHPYYPTLMVPGVIEGCRRTSLEINAWTVNNREDCLRLAAASVNAIITDKPDVALSAVRSAGGEEQ